MMSYVPGVMGDTMMMKAAPVSVSYEQQIEAKLQSTKFYDRIEAVERIT